MSTENYAKGYPGKDLYFQPHEFNDYTAYYECKSTVCDPWYPLYIDDLAKDEASRVNLTCLWFKGIEQGQEKLRKLLKAFETNVNCVRLWLDIPGLDDSDLQHVFDVMDKKKKKFVEYGLISLNWTSRQFHFIVENILLIYASEHRKNFNALSVLTIEVDHDLADEDVEFFIEKAFRYKSAVCISLEPRFVKRSGDGVSSDRNFKAKIYEKFIDAFYEHPPSILFATDWPHERGCDRWCMESPRKHPCYCQNCMTSCGRPTCVRCNVNLLRKRNDDMSWRNVYPLVLDVSLAFVSLQLPPYVLLEIIDWLPPASLCDKYGNDWNRYNKMEIISSVYKFHRSISNCQKNK